MPRLPIEGLVEKKPYGRLKVVLVLGALAGVAFGIFVATRPKVGQTESGGEDSKVVRRGGSGPMPLSRSRGRSDRRPLPAWKGPARQADGAVRPSPYSAGIWKQVEALDPRLRKWRRALHEHPEPANRETWTSRFLAGILGALKVSVRKVPGSTGLVATIKGGAGPVVALVAGMDGLPVREVRDRPYASARRVTFRGKKVWMSHAGGRDVEMTILLGVAKVLSSMDDRLPGTLLLVFQPASEQTPPGESSGARAMVRSGISMQPPVEAIFWMSARPEVRIGKVLVPEGRWWQGMTRLRIRITARDSRACASRPAGATCADPVLAASQLLVNLQTQMVRQGSESAQLTVHAMQAQGKEGLNARRVVIEGALRWRDQDARHRAVALIRRVVKGITVASGVSLHLDIEPLGRFVPSDPALVRWALPTLRRALGPGGVIPAPLGAPGLGFEKYRRIAPAMALGLGTHSAKLKRVRRLGAADFDVDEECLSVGVHVMANVVLDYLLARAKTRPPGAGRRVSPGRKRGRSRP